MENIKSVKANMINISLKSLPLIAHLVSIDFFLFWHVGFHSNQ